MPEKYEKEIEDILANYGESESPVEGQYPQQQAGHVQEPGFSNSSTVSYTHLRAHET